MPRPGRGESMSQYMHRFMGSAEAQKDFPKRKQRIAIGISMYRRRKKNQ